MGTCLRPGLQGKLAALGKGKGCVLTVVQDGRASAGDYYRACGQSAVQGSALAFSFCASFCVYIYAVDSALQTYQSLESAAQQCPAYSCSTEAS